MSVEDFIITRHAFERIKERGIPLELVNLTLEKGRKKPDEGINQFIYEQVIHWRCKHYLIRIFVNEDVMPSRVKTLYITSQIRKYYESEL